MLDEAQGSTRLWEGGLLFGRRAPRFRRCCSGGVGRSRRSAPLAAARERGEAIAPCRRRPRPRRYATGRAHGLRAAGAATLPPRPRRAPLLPLPFQRSGASTLTQQVARRLYLRDGAGGLLERKAREALTALQLEAHYSKDEILALYLNEVYYGRGAYGVEAAARVYFGVSA